MKRPNCPNCQRPLSVKDYLRTTYQRYLQCPNCQSNIEWDDIKNWHVYLYYNIFILIILFSGVFERRFEIPHLTDLMTAVSFFGSILGGYFLCHPKGITTLANSKKDDLKFIARMWARVWSILILTIIQYALIFIGLYKFFGKEFLSIYTR